MEISSAFHSIGYDVDGVWGKIKSFQPADNNHGTRVLCAIHGKSPPPTSHSKKLKIKGKKVQYEDDLGSHSLKFEGVVQSDQLNSYLQLRQTVALSVLRGRDFAFLAYGEAGSGKEQALTGADTGLLGGLLDQIDHFGSTKYGLQVSIKLTALEVFCGEATDLLSNRRLYLQQEQADSGWTSQADPCDDECMTKISLDSAADLGPVLSKIDVRLSELESQRSDWASQPTRRDSHVIYTLHLASYNQKQKPSTTNSKITLIKLAGSQGRQQSSSIRWMVDLSESLEELWCTIMTSKTKHLKRQRADSLGEYHPLISSLKKLLKKRDIVLSLICCVTPYDTIETLRTLKYGCSLASS